LPKNFSIKSIFIRLGFWLGLVFILAVTFTALLADSQKVAKVIREIDLSFLPLIILAVLFNYLLRFLKWCYFLHVLKIKVPFWQNVWVFFSAFTMVLSPGKIGELVKSFLLKARFAVPVAKSAPVIMAERLTDLLGLLILCFIGLSQFAFGSEKLLAIAILLLLVIFLFTRKAFWRFCASIIDRHSSLARFRRPIKIIEDSTVDLLSLRSLLFTAPLSAASWGGEGVALYLIFKAMNVDMPNLLLIAIFAHAFSSIVGALSFLPGGLLATEGAMGMFFVYVRIAQAPAISATLLVRALTLWFAVILGTIVFVLGHTRNDLKALSFSQSQTSDEP
jgi:uncharacterized protein (TIRG00374 family)